MPESRRLEPCVDLLVVPDGQIDVWHLASSHVDETAIRDACRHWLSADEHQRAERFTHKEAKRQFIAGRILLRAVLSRYTGVEAQRIEFQYNPHGKPGLKAPASSPVQFSLSHTRGLAVCAVTLHGPIGVDVEGERVRSAWPELANRYFAPDEAGRIGRLPPALQPAAFIEIWTLKEAFVKALGLGMAMPLADFSFNLADDGSATVSFARSDAGRPDQWQFARLQLGSSYQVAIAVQRPASNRSEIVVRELVI